MCVEGDMLELPVNCVRREGVYSIEHMVRKKRKRLDHSQQVL
jgi:hypothetical protein